VKTIGGLIVTFGTWLHSRSRFPGIGSDAGIKDTLPEFASEEQ
jgi:hypothetical protein